MESWNITRDTVYPYLMYEDPNFVFRPPYDFVNLMLAVLRQLKLMKRQKEALKLAETSEVEEAETATQRDRKDTNSTAKDATSDGQKRKRYNPIPFRVPKPQLSSSRVLSSDGESSGSNSEKSAAQVDRLTVNQGRLRSISPAPTPYGGSPSARPRSPSPPPSPTLHRAYHGRALAQSLQGRTTLPLSDNPGHPTDIPERLAKRRKGYPPPE
ncbi:MAG: hypothetical protein Q9199_005470 [Rusavskia elegans]